jgi:CheY-like chemotaxis protein
MSISTSKSTNKILIIDDDKVNNFICENILNELSSGIDVSSYTNPQLGINSILKNKETIHLIFLDLNMPVYDGWCILDLLANMGMKIPVVILTSSISLDDLQKSDKYSNVKGYLVKPATFENIQHNLNNLRVNKAIY